MFGSVVLEIAVGLVFVFLATSLAVTAANELLASLLRWRARDLAAGLRRLLGEAAGSGMPDLLAAIYNHPTIRHLHAGAATSDRKAPTYIPPRRFAMALLDVALRPADRAGPSVASLADMRVAIAARRDQLGERVTGALLTFVDQAASETRTALGDLEKLQQHVEHWFADGMDRVRDAYKRRVHLTSTVLALIVVATLNLDSLRIVRALANDSVLRQSLVTQAARTSRPPAAPPAGSDDSPLRVTAGRIQAVQSDIEGITQLGVPVGWDSETPRPDAHWWFKKMLGLLLTGLAASLGAPFWFDTLKKLSSLRPPEQTAPATPRDA